MNQDDSSSDTVATTDTLTATAGSGVSLRGDGGLLMWRLLALLGLLCLFGSIACNFYLYRKQASWQQQHAARSVRQISELQHHIDTLEQNVSAIEQSNSSRLREKHSIAEQLSHRLREQLLTLATRLHTLENTVGKLSEKIFSGHASMLLDNIESLLRLAQQRYLLFHDARGAARAYALAGQRLASLGNPAFEALHRSIDNKHQLLLASTLNDRDAVLSGLAKWRAEVPTMPLKSPDQQHGTLNLTVWERVKQALTGVLRIRHLGRGGPLAVTEPSMLRALLALDLAQAQMALLAADMGHARTALKRADANLLAHFDRGSARVQQAHASLTGWIKQIVPGAAVSVGDVLEQLHRLRLLHGRHDISPDARQSAENASSPVSGDVAGVLRDTPPASPVSPAHAVRGRPKP